jgi:hypothetical protein
MLHKARIRAKISKWLKGENNDEKYFNDPFIYRTITIPDNFDMVEMIGIEPTTCTLRTYRSPN